MEFDGSRPFQGLKRGDGSHKFHAVVGGAGIIAGQNFFVIAGAQDGGPTADAWIGIGAAVAVDGDFTCHRKTWVVQGTLRLLICLA